LLLPLAGILVLTAALGYPIALYPATAAYDWALLDAAYSLSRVLSAEDGSVRLGISPVADTLLRTDHFDHIYYSVHDLNGRLIGGDRELSAPPRGSLSAGELLYDSKIGGKDVRVAALLVHPQGESAVVQVAETTVKRYNLVRQILTGVIFIELLLLITVGALVWFGISKGLEPLQRLQQDIATRSPRDLRPVPEAHAPVEMHSVVRALNDLLLQLGAALRTQQQFVANAAHQLRTPLAGLRMQVEYGLRQDNPLEWRRTLETLGSVTERTVHLANQLLTLAKTEAGQVASMRRLDLRSVAEQVVEQWMPRAIAKDIDLGLGLEPAPLQGDAFLIGELLSNLVDNAISYTPAGGSVTVRSRIQGSATILEVEDNGVGIPEEEREKVFTRFYRVAGSPGEGCGLGLAIVQEIAYLHQGRVTISSPSGGRSTLVVVRFPAADDSLETANALDGDRVAT
jgi:two-component system sensor histidine kinase TctE